MVKCKMSQCQTCDMYYKLKTVRVFFAVPLGSLDSFEMSELITWFQEYTDFTIKSSDGQVFPCHKVYLAKNSDFFRAMLSKDFKETTTGVMEVTEFDSKTVASFLAYLYTDKLSDRVIEYIKERAKPSDRARHVYRRGFDPEKYTLPLLHMANMYQQQDLEQDCMEYLSKTVTTENAVQTWNMADMCGSQKLKESALKFIVLNQKKSAAEEIQGLEEARDSVRLLKEVLEFVADKMDMKK